MSTTKRSGTEKRSNSKQSKRVSYDPSYGRTSDIYYYENSRSPTSIYIKQPSFDELSRAPSRSNLRSKGQYYKGNSIPTGSDGTMKNLKSQLKSLKMQVSLLMNNENSLALPNPRSSLSNFSGSDYGNDDILPEEKYLRDNSDSLSITSDILLNNPLRKLSQEAQQSGYDHAHYLELENDLLKTELRNLKNKYNATKQQLREKCNALEKKNQYLEISLRKSQHQLFDCKKKIQVQLETIRFQLSRKQYQSDMAVSRIEPEKDSHKKTNYQITTLNGQLTDKNQIINDLHEELNDIQGQLQKKKFELKKQNEKNGELMKQFEIIKRDHTRNQTLLDDEIIKTEKMIEFNQNLQQKIKQLTTQLAMKDQVVGQSENMERRLMRDLQYYKNEERKLADENFELTTESTKLSQLNQSHQQQIVYLKNLMSDYVTQIDQLSKKVKMEKEKSLETQQKYRKALDQASNKEHMNNHKQSLSPQISYQDSQGREKGTKNRATMKWKTQYSILIRKYEEILKVYEDKKQQIANYYKSYKQYKSKNRILEMRNKVLEESANIHIQKIQEVETNNLTERTAFEQRIRQLESQVGQLQRINHELTDQFNDITVKYQMKCEQLKGEQTYSREIQQKITNMDIDQPNSLQEILESIRTKIDSQNQNITEYGMQLNEKEEVISKLKKQLRSVIQTQQQQFRSFQDKQVNVIVQNFKETTSESLKQLKEFTQKQLMIENEVKEQLLNENARCISHIEGMDTQLSELKKQNSNLSRLYNEKLNEFVNIVEEEESKTVRMETVVDQIKKENDFIINGLKKQVVSKSEQTLSLRSEILKLYNSKIDPEVYSVDQTIKKQLNSLNKSNQQMLKKHEQVYRLRDSLSNLRAEYDNLKSSSDIAKLRFISDKKNIEVNYEVEKQKLKSQLLVERKKVQTLEQKIKLIVGQNKKKDAFIQSWIIGKKLPITEKDLVMNFLKEYEITVTEKDISHKLQSQSQELSKLTLKSHERNCNNEGKTLAV